MGFLSAVNAKNPECRPWDYSPGMGGRDQGSSRVCAKNINGYNFVDACVPDSYTCDPLHMDFEDQVKCTLKETEPWRTDLPSFDIARDPKECHTGNVTDYNGYKICTGRLQGESCSTDKDCNAGLF